MASNVEGKFQYLIETKELIKTAIQAKGQTVSDSDPFRSYADKIQAIEQSVESPDLRYVTFKNGSTTVYTKPVAVGDDCVDVLAKGLLTKTPTKASTAQYNYTYSGWSLTNGGNASSSALSNVTENRTVYAAFTSSVRSYTITYYDSDGTTVLKTELLAYGSTPSYKPEKDGHVFDGWTPSISTVTGDATYTAAWSENLTFAGATWADIVRVSEAGEAEKYFSVGDTRELTYKQADGTETTATVFILGFNHDDLADGSGKAGISMMIDSAIDGYTLSVIKSEFDNENGGWKGSPMQKKLNSNLLGALPSALQTGIKQVTKVSRMYVDGTDTTGIVTTQDKIWLPSLGEAGYTSIYSGYGVAGGDGSKYKGLSLTKVVEISGDAANTVYFRSASYKDKLKFTGYRYSGSNGSWGSVSLASGQAVTLKCVFGFCV